MSEIRKHLEQPVEPSQTPAPRAPRLEASNDTDDAYKNLERVVEEDLKAGRSSVRPQLVAPAQQVRPPNPLRVAYSQTSTADAAPGETVAEVRQDQTPASDEPANRPTESRVADGMKVIDADYGPIRSDKTASSTSETSRGGKGGGGGGTFHKRLGQVDFDASLKAGINAVKRNLMIVMVFTVASNVLVLAIPIYLFQISDRVLTSRSTDTLIMLTVVIVGAIILQAAFDALRRFILMRTAVEFAAQLGAPILSAAARASLQGNGREYQTLGDLQQVRSFLVSRTLLAFLDAPIAPIFLLAVFLIHPHLGYIVVVTAILLLIFTQINQRMTAVPFADANAAQVKANLHLDSMTRNSQIINALAMIPEAVQIWGKDTAASLKAQVIAQDRNIAIAAMSKGVRLLTQVTMLGWGAYLALKGELTGGMVIASSIIAGRALAPIEGAIEGWNQFSQSRAAYGRISALLKASPLNFERLNLPKPEGRLDVERLLYVPQGTKRVVLNGISFSLQPGESLAVIGNSGAGKTTLGKMLVGSILPTSGNVRLDLMDLRNWDQRQFGENIGYLPQDVQLFPGTIKANIARMRLDADDEQIYRAAMLADVHEMIATLPHGYETMVAADGAPLSGGQKQRIALARAFFGDPHLVVLDEPNSNLDSAGDVALMRALQHAREQKITMITVTQRPSLLQSVDKILLLVNGTVALFGMRMDVLKALQTRGIDIEGGSFGHQLQ
ncbi:type I secretion system ATPase [Agrobacterium albertimagni AOL15]|uniref:Type I secretion system ATPase n=1 Tax=Agrobacterium albertimagni AOL15 TaxID=1156935 RepID=K2QRC9_9HYPH|nr:type I secretion system permease/ATPase [Agrobacterium albertimagni]EKF57572.1 type I secretion system ATPase [Agrobacterium albertimagni AOL15]